MPAQLTLSKQYQPRRSPLARAGQPTAPPAAQGAPGAATGPDYSGWYPSDPVLQAAMQATQTKALQQDLNFTAARQSALIGLGSVPDPSTVTDPSLRRLLEGIAPDVLESTRQLADQATKAGLSTTGQLADAYKKQQSGDIGNIAGRGLLRSGAYRQHSRENLQGYQQGLAGAQIGLSTQLAGLAQGHNADQQTNATEVQSAVGDSTARLVAAIQSGQYGSGTSGLGTTTTPASSPSSTTSYQVSPLAPHPAIPAHVGGTATVPRPTLALARKKPLL